MKNLLIVFTIFSLTACTSSDDDAATTADTTAPIITLLGTNPETAFIGETYTDAGASASDAEDGNMTASIETVSSVDTSTAGTYSVTYNVSDASGNAATEVTRTVNVTSAEQLIIGNWTSTSTDSEGSYNSRITIIESGEMSVYTEITLTTGAIMQSVDGMTWTLNGNLFTTTDTFFYNDDDDDVVDTATITVINQNSFSFLSDDGETLTLNRDSDYESTIVGTWQYVFLENGCQYTIEYDFSNSNEFTGSNINDCNDDATTVSGPYTTTGILSGAIYAGDEEPDSEQTYFAVQGDKFYLYVEEGNNGNVFTKQ